MHGHPTVLWEVHATGAWQTLVTPTVSQHPLPTCAAPACLQVVKNIVSQSTFQLAVMAALVFRGDVIFGVPSAASVQGPSEHYTIVFNAFVMMQLFNQVGG